MSLMLVQSKLKAPKSQYNAFGKYNYRSTEDIMEAVKPLLIKHNGFISLTDTIEEFAGKIFVKATVVLQFHGEKTPHYASAYAEQALQQKGMSTPQLTLSASSFARKQALQGMFAIDDSSQAYEETMVNDVVVFDANSIKNLIKETGADLAHFQNYFKNKKVDDFSKAELAKAGAMLTKKLEKTKDEKKDTTEKSITKKV